MTPQAKEKVKADRKKWIREKYPTASAAEKKIIEMLEAVEIKEDDMYIRIQEGNSKLQGILNFNIPPLTTCPFKTELCAVNCYAFDSYAMSRKNVSLSHQVNYQMTLRNDFVEKMIEAIEKQLNRKKYKGKKVIFRIHSSGDLYSYDYLKKWIAITDHFKDREISFGCYTKSLPFLKSFLKETGRSLEDININFMSSIWADTKEKFIKLTEEMEMNIFTAYPHGQMPKEYIPCADDTEEDACGNTCNLCYEKDQKELLTNKWENILNEAFGRKKIAIEIH